jgi:diaminopimelate decarboxylase
MRSAAPASLARSVVLPRGARVNDRRRLEVGGCDVVEIARELGTPAYVYAGDDIRPRAREYLEAFRARDVEGEVLYAIVADRAAAEPDTLATIAGMHCESGDILVRDAALASPRPGDVLVTPATGAYGYALASNYNGVPRPPVVFCRDGEARVVLRRETYDDLMGRDA